MGFNSAFKDLDTTIRILTTVMCGVHIADTSTNVLV